MDHDILAKNIAKELINSFTDSLKKLNLYTVLQAAFIIELYYLLFNSLSSHLSEFFYSEGLDLYSRLPEAVLIQNEFILSTLNIWMPFVLLMAINFFIAGICVSLINLIPELFKYELIRKYSSYGIYASVWLGLIWLTFYMFEKTGKFFIIFFLAIFLIGAIVKKAIGKLISRLESL